MRSDEPSGASKKRKRSSSRFARRRRRIPRNIVYHPAVHRAARSRPELPAVSFCPMLNTPNEAYQSALSDEALAAARPIQPMEDWNWELSAMQIAGRSEEELTIWKDLLVCRESLRLAGITVHPANWTMPVVDLTQWQPIFLALQMHAWNFIFRLLSDALCSDTLGRMAILNMYQQQPCKHHAWVSTRQDDAVRFAAKSLNEPNILDPAQGDAYTLIKSDPKAYEARIRAQAEAWKPDLVTGLAGRPILQPVE
ncbi:hypothetical protein B0H17DRAFT_1069004 [Mycena rosella]|uniref:Uncharacterized protein n=1 Tax=Mycena rosella TaxID=1033263 RepID=A0AAD7DCA9_MYCRO|nr:hypothetical protein B0H17DRAFT_1069004 [Mycena rosella]